MSEDTSPDRRDLLKSLGMMSVTGATVTTAGCFGNDSSNGNGNGNGNGTASGAENLGPPVESLVVTFPTSGYDPERYQMIQEIHGAWEDLGLEYEFKTVDATNIIDRIYVEHDYQFALAGWGGNAPRIDPDVFLNDLFHSANIDTGQRNINQYQKPDRYDPLAEEQSQEFDRDARQEIVYEAQEVLAEDQPTTPIYEFSFNLAYNHERWNPDEEDMNHLGEGHLSFWNHLSAEPASDDVEQLRIGFPGDNTSLNPLDRGHRYDAQTVRFIWDRLYAMGSDGVPKKWAAESSEVLEKDKVQITIREGMTFHDGEPVTPEDIKFSFNYHAEYGPITGPRAQTVDQIEIVDDQTMIFNLVEPYAPFFSNVLTQVTILPKHIWSDIPEEIDAENPVEWDLDGYDLAIGSGPFEFNYWEREQELSMTAFEDHFNPPTPDEVVRVHRSSTSAIADGLEEGTIDMVGQGIGAAMDRLEQQDHLTTHVVGSHGWVGMQYKCTEGPFRDKSFRHAMAHSIDKQHMVEVIKSAPSPICHSVITPANEFWHNPDVREFNFDLDQAKQILRDDGWGWDDEGRLHYPENWEPPEPHE